MSSRKIRILQTIRQGKVGGGETHLLDLVEHLDKKQFECVVLSFSEGEMIARLKSMGVKNYVIPSENPFDIFKWSKVTEIIKREKIDLIHAHGSRACSNVYHSAQKTRKPLIYTIHGWSFHPNQKPLVKKARQLMESFLCNKSDLNICVSKSNEEEGKRLFNLQKSIVINNGINIDKFNPNLKCINVRENLNIPRRSTLVGYIARLTEQKDPFTLMKAIQIIIEKEMNIRFLVVGSGNLKEATIKLADELRISSYITFQDFRSDVPAILKNIDIYCLPSLWEGLPIGILEAMAMRKAVVASAVDGTNDLINNGENGLLIQPGNPEQLANAILLLHHDEELLYSLGDNAQKTVLRQYNVKAMTSEIEKVYLSYKL